jgi:hypothetical protein
MLISLQDSTGDVVVLVTYTVIPKVTRSDLNIEFFNNPYSSSCSILERNCMQVVGVCAARIVEASLAEEVN